MLQIIPSHHENVVVVKATGLLTDADYNEFVAGIEAILKERGHVSILVEFENFRGWEPKALWADFKFGMAHEDDFKKMALVGEKAWHHFFAVVVRAFTSAEVRYFDHDSIQQAWDWILDNGAGAEDESAENDQKDEEAAAEEGCRPYTRIVVAMDFSPHARRALNRALELAGHYGAAVLVMHALESMMRYDVYPDDFLGPSPGLSIYDPELDQQLFDSAVKRLEELVKPTGYPDISWEVVWGSPTSTILSYAESQKADLIVAGSHGRRGLARLLGSTANGILHSARCDVLVVRLD